MCFQIKRHMLTYNGITFKEFISRDQIQDAVNEVAARITHDYAGKSPLFICVLNGAFMYASDLLKAVKLPAEITFVRLKSYEGTETTGKVNMLIPLQVDVRDRDVIIVEDIVDTGITMHAFKQNLREMGAKSVALTAFLYKPESLRHADAKPEYYGLEIPPAFIIGYGLDLDEQARNLDSIYVKAD